MSACKVYATPDGVDVWHWNPDDQKAEVIAHGPALTRTRDANAWTMVCDDGTPLRFAVDPKDCGCSHPLKRFRPAVPVRDYAAG